jgi:hypothetical protein
VLFVPVTAALKSCCALVFNCTLLGETVTATWPGATIVTNVEPDSVGLKSEVAVTATVAGLGAMAGAV